MPSPPLVDFGPEICGSLDPATDREWLVTNGIGGFASGTISGVLTRRYHGLLVAALDPPGNRTLLVAKFDELLAYDGRRYELGANCWADGSISPEGFCLLQRFHLKGTTPAWTFACADALLEKRIWMQEGSNTTYVRYELLRGSAGAADIEIKALVNYRDFHATTRAGNCPLDVAPVEHGVAVVPREPGVPFYLLSNAAQAEPRREWYRNFALAAEHARGLDDQDDHLFAAVLRARLQVGQPVTVVLSTDAHAGLSSNQALSALAAGEDKLLELWVAAHPQASLDAPPWIRQLVLAAAQFPVFYAAPGDPAAHTMVAGYPWFGEWSRDTMIALPGLALETGRPDLARSILRTASRFLDEGMLPNLYPETFPDAAPAAPSGNTKMNPGPAPAPPHSLPPGVLAQYNSVDATLWYFEALRQYYAATSDKKFVLELYDGLAGVLDWHVRGTRYGIQMDAADGLLYAGQPGVQLTWMDAKANGQVVTPRIGKPVEVNALWYNALRSMARFAFELEKPAEEYVRMAERAQAGFARFWNAGAGFCFDVIDGPGGHGDNDASLRPNQIFAVSLPESPLTPEQRRAVVDVCARRLITPHGVRTLDTADPRYRGQYLGDPAARDAAYHQGTAWPWLLGPFVVAHLRVYNDPALAFTFLEPLSRHLCAAGLGTISEIFDGDAPFQPRGAIAQAWSVGEILRAWHACHDAGLPLRRAAAK